MRDSLVVAIDLDSTIYDLLTPWLAWIETTFGERKRIDEILTWDLHEYFAAGTRIYEFLNIKGMFHSLKLFEGAQAAINRVHEMGVTQMFVSTCVTKTGSWEKQAAIKRDFPALAKQVVITSGLKGAIDADMLVDDGPHNLLAFQAHRQHAPEPRRLTAKVPYRYNEHVATDLVIHDWYQYEAFVKHVQNPCVSTLWLT